MGYHLSSACLAGQKGDEVECRLGVNRASQELGSVNQQNAALVEEVAATSKSVDDRVNGLGKMMGFLKWRP